MKATGIVRKVDELGRIVLPAELRRTLSIAEKDPLEIYVDGGSIILQKHEERCVFCGGSEDLHRLGQEHLRQLPVAAEENTHIKKQRSLSAPPEGVPKRNFWYAL